jgi:hypothetical protein
MSSFDSLPKGWISIEDFLKMIVEESTWTFVGGSTFERHRLRWVGKHAKGLCSNTLEFVDSVHLAVDWDKL